MNNPEKRSCKEYCYVRRCCYVKGEPGRIPAECPNAWYIQEHMDEERYEYDEEDEEE